MRRTDFAPIGWHVMARGARRLDLFRDDNDFREFFRILGYALDISGAVLWAYALMSNHYHLVIYASTKQLTACMRRVNRLYSLYHNRRYGLSGHAFDGPYLAYPQGSKRLLLRSIAYVLLNPVVAGIVDRAENYAWSSGRDYLGLKGSPLKVNPTQVMSYVSPKISVAWGWFQQALDREIRRAKRSQNASPSRLEVQGLQFEWLLEHAQERAADFKELDPTEVAIHWARKCGVTPKAMARVLVNQTAKDIGNILTRMARRVREDVGLAARIACP